MIDWLAVRQPPIEAVEHGVAQAQGVADPYTGPLTFDRIDYPAAQVMPVSSDRTGGNEWTHRIDVFLYFEWGRDMDYTEDALHPLASVIEETLSALSELECIGAYYPASIEDAGGESPQGDLVYAVRVQFEATTLVDVSEF